MHLFLLRRRIKILQKFAVLIDKTNYSCVTALTQLSSKNFYLPTNSPVVSPGG